MQIVRILFSQQQKRSNWSLDVGGRRQMGYRYDSEFFDFVNASSGKSARLFLDELTRRVLREPSLSSVLDVGCGRGVWIADWQRRGLSDFLGLDGDYVDVKTLLIPAGHFKAADISQPVDLGRKFDLVECLEVAEHVSEAHADTLIDNLVRHGDLVLFSAAVPGQGGEFHVNERPYDYWRQKFAARGYEAFDSIRPCVRHLNGVEPWYRYNAFIYATSAGQVKLTDAARATKVPAGSPLVNVAPLLWRVRCAAISVLPTPLMFALARLKHRVANSTLRL